MSKQRGFTLIEILVTIFIITVLSGVVVVNQKEGQRTVALTRSAHKLAQDLRGAEEMALVGKTFYDNFPDGGYGIHFINDSNSYIIFADCDNDQQYDEGLVCPDCTSGSCIDYRFSEKVRESNMEELVKINSISPSSPLDITYIPPDPTIYINTVEATEAIITISIDSQTRNIKINSAGLIDVD